MPSTEGTRLIINAFGQLQNAAAQVSQSQARAKQLKLEQDRFKLAKEEEDLRREALERGAQQLEQGISGTVRAQGPVAPGATPPILPASPEDQQLALLRGGLDLARGGNQPLGNQIVQGLIQRTLPENIDSETAAKIAKTRAETQRIQTRTIGDQIGNQRAAIALSQDGSFLEAKANLGNVLSAQADQAATPRERRQLQIAGLQIQGAQTPTEIASALKSFAPNTTNPSSAFQAILGEVGDPVKALEIVKGIDQKNRLELEQFKRNAPRDFGNERESLSAILFEGERFDALSPAQKKKVEDAVFERRAEAKRKELEGTPLKGEALKQVTALGVIRDEIKRIKQLAKENPGSIGRVSGQKTRAKIATGLASPGEVELAQRLEFIREAFGRLQSGGAITSDELVIFKSLTGAITDAPETFEARLLSFDSQLESRENAIRAGAVSPASGRSARQAAREAKREIERPPPAPGSKNFARDAAPDDIVDDLLNQLGIK